MATKETKIKEVNYTEAQAAELKAAYVAAPTRETVDAFAAKFGKSARSIIAKLSRMDVYKAKEYTTKQGEKPTSKNEHATFIGRVLGLSDAETDSLEKVNKTALAKLRHWLINSKPLENGEGPEDSAG